MFLMDVTVIPMAVVILTLVLRSYTVMVVPILNILVCNDDVMMTW